MSHKQSVALLSSVLRPDNDARPTFLLGAGASFSSGIPLADESVRRIAKQAYVDVELGGGTLPEHVKTSEWLAWLRNQPWFVQGDSKLAENFPLVVKHLLQPDAYRRRVMTELTTLKGEIGQGYRSLAELVLRGLAGTILTTNFDICLPKALNDKRPHIREVAEVNRGDNDFIEFNLYSRAQIVWLHGKTEQYTDRNQIEETRQLDPKLIETIAPLLNATPLVVVGYRGAEPSIMDSLLGPNSEAKYRNGIYWCVRSGEEIHPNVAKLADRLGKNFQLLEISGFDDLFNDLNAALFGVQRYASPDTRPSTQRFDDEAEPKASWADVDADAALNTLKQYASKLELGHVSSENLRPLMRNLGLIVRQESSEHPSKACLLLFGRNTNRFFPHAVISATINGKNRRVFGGNLISQYRNVLEWLEQEKVNPQIKLKGSRTHSEQQAYAGRALVEVVVNMLVHRDYEIVEPSAIRVVSGSYIQFENPGAQSHTASGKLAFDSEGAFEPLPEFSELRNRALCDIFFGISAMERAGTGLVDTGELTRQLGGTAKFAFPPEADRFIATLHQPESSAGTTTIAKNTRPLGTYLINFLPLASMPDTLTHLRIRGTWTDLERHTELRSAGTFVFEARSGDLWTFLPLETATRIFSSVLDGPGRTIPIGECQDDPILSRKLSWLLRKHFERFLSGFSDEGLVIERSKNGSPAKRAYFQSKNRQDRIYQYDSPSRRNIKRGVAKRRGDDRQPWFECEGFGYEVVNFTGLWGIRIKPFYMFTKSDGISPLPGYMRTRRATRRIRFDRNQSVESDMVFWGRFLSQGSQTINISDMLEGDLLLEGEFYTIEVEEGGLLSNGLETQDKRTA